MSYRTEIIISKYNLQSIYHGLGKYQHAYIIVGADSTDAITSDKISCSLSSDPPLQNNNQRGFPTPKTGDNSLHDILSYMMVNFLFTTKVVIENDKVDSFIDEGTVVRLVAGDREFPINNCQTPQSNTGDP